jgi:hypothetical protein
MELEKANEGVGEENKQFTKLKFLILPKSTNKIFINSHLP